jgi:membrane-bound metal-dependent hydrolase YbcI (DUF457 family)
VRDGGWSRWPGFALPDWDGLPLLLGQSYYAEIHRVWGHNLLVGAAAAVLVATALYRFDLFGWSRRWLSRRWSAMPAESQTGPPARSWGGWAVWMAVAVVASYSHLVIDVAYCTGRNLSDWGVPLYWPFSARMWTFPSVQWGDVTATLILSAAMFAMLRWPSRAQRIAAGSLGLIVGYILLRAALR